MTTQTRVTIGLPVYNGANYLERALDTILGQDYEGFELIISDNGSTDTTLEICERYAAADSRIQLHRFAENQGAAANYNKTFELARGELFKWAAHDDEYEPTYIRKCVEAFDAADESVVLVYPRARFIDEYGKVISDDTDHLATQATHPRARLAFVLDRVNMANPVFGLIRSQTLRQTRLIDRFIASDYVLLAEIALLGKLVELPEFLFFRRTHADSSRAANVTNRDVASWFDPKAGRPLIPPRLRLLYEYERSVFAMPIPFGEKLLAAITVPRVYYLRRMRVIGGRWKRKIKKFVGAKTLTEAP